MHRADLTGVSETALLTLNGRAHQASLPDAILHDPMAVRLRDAIDADYDKFGRRGQEMALRSLAADACTREYLQTHPQATVVALAEGFQTSFWRLDQALPNAQFRWLSVDLAPVIALREKLLPPSPRITNLAQSALDYSWMDHVDATDGVQHKPLLNVQRAANPGQVKSIPGDVGSRPELRRLLRRAAPSKVHDACVHAKTT